MKVGAQYGPLEKSYARELCVGDILDVNIWLDIVVHRAEDGVPRTSFHFSFDRIVRIAKSLGPVSQIFLSTDDRAYILLAVKETWQAH